MYPINMHNPSSLGYAVANNADEHKMLTEAGYVPPLVEDAEEPAEPAEPAKRGPGRPRKVQ